MAQATEIEVGNIVARKTVFGGTFYKGDKFVHLTHVEWEKLFSLDLDLHNPDPEQICGEKIVLDDNAEYKVFVQVEFYNGFSYIDVRHYYIADNIYLPSRAGVKFQTGQWEVVANWNRQSIEQYCKQLEQIEHRHHPKLMKQLKTTETQTCNDEVKLTARTI
jgi:hypothetical protein